jgi:VWFA-related protein
VRRVGLSVVLGVSLAVAFHLAANAQPYTERVEVTVANVDVVVTDADGNPVRGLTKDDFELFESGKKQAITNFTAIDVAPRETPSENPSGADEVARPPARQPRLIILFVDIGEIEPSRRVKFFDAVRSFLDGAFRDGDVVAVLAWNHRVRVVLAPTSDRRTLDTVIEVLGAPFGSKESAIADRLAELHVNQAEHDAALSLQLGLGGLSDAKAERDFQEFITSEERCAAIKRKARELRNMLASFSRVELQKVLVFASDDMSLGPSYGIDPREYRPPTCYTTSDLDLLASTANAYGITIHAFHPPGARDSVKGPDRGGALPSANDPAPLASGYLRAFDEEGGLLLLARRTGGLSGAGPAVSAKLLERAARELDVYYSLGYRVTSPGDDKARKISVTTKNRNHRIRVRDSVVHLSNDSRISDLVTTNLYLPENNEAKGPAFTVRMGAGKRDGRFVVVPVEILFDARALALLPSTKGKSKGAVSFFVTSGRELGDASDVTEIRKDFEIPTPAVDAPSNVLYSFAVRVRPDTRRLSVALRDNVSGDVGTRVVALGGSGKTP